jgi:hypothetical protein
MFSHPFGVLTLSLAVNLVNLRFALFVISHSINGQFELMETLVCLLMYDKQDNCCKGTDWLLLYFSRLSNALEGI